MKAKISKIRQKENIPKEKATNYFKTTKNLLNLMQTNQNKY
jgi:hypothetical protein